MLFWIVDSLNTICIVCEFEFLRRITMVCVRQIFSRIIVHFAVNKTTIMHLFIHFGWVCMCLYFVTFQNQPKQDSPLNPTPGQNAITIFFVSNEMHEFWRRIRTRILRIIVVILRFSGFSFRFPQKLSLYRYNYVYNVGWRPGEDCAWIKF